MIALAHHNPTPAALDHRAAVEAVLAANRAMVDAYQAWHACPIGTPEFVELLAAWQDAEEKLTDAMLREQTLRAQAQGRAWLREVVNG